jgi:hypothetical protein
MIVIAYHLDADAARNLAHFAFMEARVAFMDVHVCGAPRRYCRSLCSGQGLSFPQLIMSQIMDK